MLLKIVASFWWCFAAVSEALFYDVEASADHYGARGFCIKYHVPGHSLVNGHVKIVGHSQVRTGVLVFDNLGNQPFSQPDLNGEGRFSFRSLDTPTEYDFCIRALPKAGTNAGAGTKIPVDLVVKFDYDLFDEQLAQNFKVKPIETEFVILEEVMRRVADEMSTLMKNEEDLRDTNESILVRVNWFSILSILYLVGLGVWQLFYLKRFFKAKKLI